MNIAACRPFSSGVKITLFNYYAGGPFRRCSRQRAQFHSLDVVDPIRAVLPVPIGFQWEMDRFHSTVLDEDTP